MSRELAKTCDACDDSTACPDRLVDYNAKFDEYGLLVHDGGSSAVLIAFCPWCGTKLAESKRDRWFEELAARGYDEPMDQKIPAAYETDAWYLDVS